MATIKANIEEPSKKDYRNVENLVRDYASRVNWLLNSNNPLNKAYEELQATDLQLQQALGSYEDLTRLAANNQFLLMQDAARLAMLQGPPPPEKSAQAPLIGKAREPWKPARERGRQALRIQRSTAS